MKKNKRIFLFSLLTTSFLLVLFVLLYRKFNRHHNYSNDNHLQIGEKEAKEEILQEFSNLFQVDSENLESNLYHLAQKTNYLENTPVKDLSEKLEEELKRNSKTIFSSLPKTPEELQEVIENATYRKKILLTTVFLPRVDNSKSIDWKKTWKKN